jgi:hypothetical protein
MILTILAAWWASKPLQWATAALVLLGGYEAWKFHERNIGAGKVIATIEKKADENATHASHVRQAVEDGRVRGRPDPYGLRD